MNSEEILKEIERLFEEEKYSKFQLSEYNLSKFQRIDALIEEIQKNKLEDSILEKANEYLKKNEFSLIALYLVAYFSYNTKRDVFLNGFTKIMKNLVDRQKW